jgi:chitinase
MVGYYQSWNVRNRVCNKVSPRDLNTTGYTHLFYSFASIDPATYRIAPAHTDDPAMMREFTGLAKDGLQTWIAIGGFDFSDPGTPTHTTWSDVCATKARRAAFINSVKEYMDEYGFQGVDLDWEYPGDPSRGGNGLDDTKNLVLLVKEMRAAYGNAYGISLTLAPDYWYLRWFDPKGMEPYVDFFGFMAYDLHGSWDSDVLTLGKKVRGQADIREIANNTVPLWFDGLDPAKINFGLAMYGRGYTLADPTCNQLLCPFSGASDPAPCTNSKGVMSLLEIQQLIKRKGLTPQYLADSMMKQITWDDQWIGYDDEETFAAKKAWADSRCFGGTMVWSIDFQVTGSGNSDDETYGDVVYVGSEVFQEPTAQCPAPCVMVFPPSTLSEPKVVTIPPYSATLEVGTTTTTVVVVPTEVTATITVIDFFNQYISAEQQPGEVMTLRPSFQPPPARVVVTGEDGQTTTRTVLPPPLGGGAGSIGGGGEPGPGQNQTGGVPVTSIPSAATDWPWVPPPTATPKPNVDDDDEVVPPFLQDSDSPPPPPDSTTPFPVDPTASIEPVIDPSKPPPPGGTRVRCTSWFFFICISWLDLNIKVDWWDIVLPPGGIGPGPPPVSLLKLPPGWKIQCPGPLPCLPPWPKMTVGPGGEFPSELAKPTPCEVTTATLTIESTSYGTTTTEGTVRTITTRTFSSEFPILGCAITDATVATSVTACSAPTPLVRRFDDAISAVAAHQDDSGSIANDSEDRRDAIHSSTATVLGAPLGIRADGDQCEDPRLVDAFCTAKDRLDEAKAILWKQMIENERNANPRKYEEYTVVEISEPFYIVGFVYLTQIRRDYLRSLTATGFVCPLFLCYPHPFLSIFPLQMCTDTNN